MSGRQQVIVPQTPDKKWRNLLGGRHAVIKVSTRLWHRAARQICQTSVSIPLAVIQFADEATTEDTAP